MAEVMDGMAMAEKIKILLVKRKMSVKELAEKLGCSSQNLSGKFKRDNFSEKELEDIAIALDVKYEGTFELPETGEKI
jgi:DNA-binding Xre family transcriptional regulator